MAGNMWSDRLDGRVMRKLILNTCALGGWFGFFWLMISVGDKLS